MNIDDTIYFDILHGKNQLLVMPQEMPFPNNFSHESLKVIVSLHDGKLSNHFNKKLQQGSGQAWK